MTTPALRPARLRCAYLTDPLGVAPERVRFGWVLHGGGSGRRQAAYQVRVFAGSGLAWESGRVETDECSDIGYGGGELARGARYEWSVRVWDEQGEASAWSERACFETELDQVAGWAGASWIAMARTREDFLPPVHAGPPDPLAKAMTPVAHLRREFTVGRQVASARLHVTARGLYEARLNGERVGDAVLAPGWTDYASRIHYQTFDVTGQLRSGSNVLGALLADGWYCGFAGFNAKQAGAHYGTAPELVAQLVIDYEDGGTERIGTDGQWLGRYGAIRQADLLMGEFQDFEREIRGWDAPGFEPAGWHQVKCAALDGVPLLADPGPPVRVIEEVAPVAITRDPAGRQIVDFGQNLTGWLRLRAVCAGGATVSIRHAETLDGDGGLYTDNLRTARQHDTFAHVRAGQVVEPRFTIHGFRYAEISGLAGELTTGDVAARVVHSDIGVTGAFESSALWLNKLFANIGWGQRGNFVSVPTDCPQRDERLGWLGDAQIFARTACYNRDVAAFLAKWLDDVADAQFPTGAYSDIAPRLRFDWAGAPGWGDAGVIVPWTLYQMYGDRACLDRHFGAMTRWMRFIERGNPAFLRTADLGNSYNDWLAPGDDLTPPELLATAYWAYDAELMARICAVTGRGAEAERYRELRAKIGAAFADAFVAADGSMASGTQTAYALGLHMGLVPARLRDAAAGHLIGAIERTCWRLTTGFVGVGYLLPVLSACGHTAAAYRLLEQPCAPSWRYMVDSGATTIWERWDGWTAERGFQSASMNSLNHYALGSVGEWLYRFVLGIELASGAAGFGRLTIRPHPGGELRWARGRYDSVLGPVSSSWGLDSGAITVRVELPPNVTATVHVASADPGAVRDAAGRGPGQVGDFPGARGVKEAVFEIGSGAHEFSGPWAGDC